MAWAVRDRRLPFRRWLGSVRVDPSPLIGCLHPVSTWGRVLEAMDHWLPWMIRPAYAVLKDPFLLLVALHSSRRQRDQLGKVGEEKGHELHLRYPLESVRVGPSPPVDLIHPKDTWERDVAARGHSLRRCGQLEKALEARDLVRLEHVLKLRWAQEGRCTL